jgi:hypothetical protein
MLSFKNGRTIPIAIIKPFFFLLYQFRFWRRRFLKDFFVLFSGLRGVLILGNKTAQKEWV